MRIAMASSIASLSTQFKSYEERCFTHRLQSPQKVVILRDDLVRAHPLMFLRGNDVQDPNAMASNASFSRQVQGVLTIRSEFGTDTNMRGW
jgi:hypothetical protein